MVQSHRSAAGFRTGVSYSKDMASGTVMSGFPELDRYTRGFPAGTLSVIAARPAMGKTELVLEMAAKIAENGTKVFLFSCDHTEGEIAAMLRLKTEDCSIPMSICSGVCDAGEITDIAEREAKGGIIIIDGLQYIYADCPDARIFVPGSQKAVFREDAKVLFMLRNLARRTGIPVIVTSGLPRCIERRRDRRPRVRDLLRRHLFPHADTVIALYRDDYYQGISEQESTDVELIILRNRNGPSCCTVTLEWDAEERRLMEKGAGSEKRN